MAVSARDWAEERGEPRDEVHHRARAFGPSDRPLNLLVVNISARGMMARCDVDFPVGERLRVHLPVTGSVGAEVRWCLGGRMGFQFDRVIRPDDYQALLGAMARD